MAKSNKKPQFEVVAEKLIAELEKGTSIFQKPWKDNPFVLPFNPTTDKKYRGLNSLWLQMQGYDDPRWMTFKQAQANDWKVMKGAKGSVITYIKPFAERTLKDEHGKPILDENGEPKKAIEQLDRPIITSAVVFNAKQISGIPEYKIEQTQVQQWENQHRAELITTNSGANISHGGNQAFYNPIGDSITMPKKEQFPDASGYYATLLHELGHWTGHSSRLDRPMIARFGTPDYAKEELRAEIASLMLSGEIGVSKDFGQHAAYVKSWVSILKDEPFELYRASSDAQKIMDYILQFEQKQQIEQKHQASFMLHDNISYKNDTYRVTALLRAKNVEVTVQSTGQVLRLTPKDGLYHSLSNAINRQQMEHLKTEVTRNQPDRDTEQDTGYSGRIKR